MAKKKTASKKKTESKPAADKIAPASVSTSMDQGDGPLSIVEAIEVVLDHVEEAAVNFAGTQEEYDAWALHHVAKGLEAIGSKLKLL